MSIATGILTGISLSVAKACRIGNKSAAFETSMFDASTNTNEYSHASSIRPYKTNDFRMKLAGIMDRKMQTLYRTPYL
jgi:hypothetical protein